MQAIVQIIVILIAIVGIIVATIYVTKAAMNETPTPITPASIVVKSQQLPQENQEIYPYRVQPVYPIYESQQFLPYPYPIYSRYNAYPYQNANNIVYNSIRHDKPRYSSNRHPDYHQSSHQTPLAIPPKSNHTSGTRSLKLNH